MATLISLSIKTKAGVYENYTISVNDETDQYGNNVAMWVEQNAEQRQNKERRTYVGNGKVIWTDGKSTLAERKEKPSNFQPQASNQQEKIITNSAPQQSSLEDDDLPF
jgi:hypothetical protein